jgi:hypothetical protein
MKTIAGGFLTVFGIGWIGILALMYQVEKLAEGKSSFVMVEALIIAAPGLILLGVGLFLFITGKISDRKLGILMAQKAQKAEDIANNGIPARGRVTFVDKNYSLLLNEKPIYSIVEFTYEDHLGRPHIGRKENVDSDLVIRAQIAVGSEVDIKYMAANPDENALLIREPGMET